MRLAGSRSFFELNVLDYEYPASTAYRTDRNLLLIGFRAGWHKNQTAKTAPLLLTWELDALINWLRQLRDTGRMAPRLAFSEPCLAFECLSASANEFLLQIKMAQEATPDWHQNPQQPFWLPIVVTAAQISDAIHQLKSQAEIFPVRP
ncbi:hypothetical protein GCM10023189_34060 [Nibrella saemangeumensis]|uniref:Uncharacterized protein n=1 Tax=Nibrella saemangeumensis TaxID=1084526 RepID=A0ABP8N4K6_9BACT